MTDPAKPTLVAEWRAILTLSSGIVVTVSYDSRADAEAAATRIAHRASGATLQLERRLVGPWQPWVMPTTDGHGARDRQQR